jgi:hypothetical protein
VTDVHGDVTGVHPGVPAQVARRPDDRPDDVDTDALDMVCARLILASNMIRSLRDVPAGERRFVRRAASGYVRQALHLLETSGGPVVDVRAEPAGGRHLAPSARPSPAPLEPDQG